MKRCPYCGREEFLTLSGACGYCHQFVVKRGEMATAIVAGYFNGWLTVSERQIERAVQMADELIKILCRTRPV